MAGIFPVVIWMHHPTAPNPVRPLHRKRAPMHWHGRKVVWRSIESHVWKCAADVAEQNTAASFAKYMTGDPVSTSKSASFCKLWASTIVGWCPQQSVYGECLFGETLTESFLMCGRIHYNENEIYDNICWSAALCNLESEADQYVWLVRLMLLLENERKGTL